jgi:hypothetical protein
MSKLKSIAVCLLLTLACMALPAAAQTIVTQLPNTCSQGSVYTFVPSGGSYSGVPASGNYICVGDNILLPFGATGTTLEVTGANFTNATATAATITAGGVPLSWPVSANTNYRYSCTIFWQGSSTATTLKLVVTAPASPTNLFGFAQIYSDNAGTNTAGALSSGAFTGVAANAATTTYKAVLDGVLENGSTAGALTFQAAAPASSTTITIVRGSYCSVTTGN